LDALTIAALVRQLLQAELDKLAVGASTNFMVVQDEGYLAQARSTEVAARSDWMKAQLPLDRARGNLLEKNNIVFDDAIKGQMRVNLRINRNDRLIPRKAEDHS
jgi:outer membrane protein